MHTLINELENLRQRMQQHRSSDIAKRSGIHVNTVRAIKNGVNLNPTIGNLVKLYKTVTRMENSNG